MDRASKIAQEIVHRILEDSRRSNPPARLSPMEYEAAIAERLRREFPQTKRASRKGA